MQATPDHNNQQLTPFRVVDQRLLPTAKAAELIGFSASFLHHDRCRTVPAIPFVKIGRQVRYRMSDLLAFMNQPAKAA